MGQGISSGAEGTPSPAYLRAQVINEVAGSIGSGGAYMFDAYPMPRIEAFL